MGNIGVREYEGQHGAHVGLDHARALGDRADADAAVQFDGVCLRYQVGGHDGLICGQAAFGRRACLIEYRVKMAFNPCHVQGPADDARGCHPYSVRVYSEAGGQDIRHRDRIPDALLMGKRVGAAAVGDDAVELAAILLHVVLRNEHGGRPDLIEGEHCGRWPFRQYDGQAHLSFLNAVRLDAFDGANAAFDSFHWCLVPPSPWMISSRVIIPASFRSLRTTSLLTLCLAISAAASSISSSGSIDSTSLFMMLPIFCTPTSLTNFCSRRSCIRSFRGISSQISSGLGSHSISERGGTASRRMISASVTTPAT